MSLPVISRMIELIRIHALIRLARVLIFVGTAADRVRKAACRKAGALAIEATARMDGRDAASRRPE